MIKCASIIFTFFCFISATNAQVASCLYGIEWLEVSNHFLKNNSYYSCKLNTKQSNENIKISRLIGRHYPRYNDNYVTLLSITSDNKLKLFSPYFCRKFPNLQVIYTQFVNLLTFDQDSLVNCGKLKALSSNGNRLHAIDEFLLNRNQRLIFLSLEHNQLNTFPENLLVNQKELLELRLNYNDLRLIPKNTFKSLKNLQILELYKNGLFSIDPGWFLNLQNLRSLKLTYQQIYYIQPNTFINLINLETLTLNLVREAELYPNFLNGLQNLKHLNLYNSSITELPPNFFAPLVNLESLKIQKNQLTTIHSDLFGYHRNLTTIMLDENLISSFDARILDKTAVSKLYMHGNHDICAIDSLSRPQIRQNLNLCFSNYKPRSLESVTSTPQPIQSQQKSTILPQIPSISPNRSNYCGQRITGHGNIIGGTQIARGDYPWLAAIVMRNGKFFCAGNLITSRKIITAAHCIQDKHSSLPTAPQDILVLLGAFDLDKTIETGRISHAVQSVNMHPDWNTLTESFDADIAVLVLESDATFSRYIQPVCLLSSVSNLAAANLGIVVGYGKSEDETKIHENIPKILNSQIHSNPYCFLDNRALARISSGRTFCGGPGRGIGVCNGDSGGGLYVTGGNVFYLRGIVSSSLVGGQYGCNVDTYSVFTDVLKFTNWIFRI